VLRQEWRALLDVTGMTAVVGIAFYTVFVWMPTYQTHIVRPPVAHALFINGAAMVALMAAVPLAAALADRVGGRRVIAVASLAFAAFTVPLFGAIDTGHVGAVLGATALFVVMFAGLNGPRPAAVAAKLPAPVRYTGLGIGCNVAFGLFGGTAPVVATWLIASTGDVRAPAWYVAGAALLGSVLVGIRSFSPEGGADRTPRRGRVPSDR
jgi:MHS family proline/betaine transporter-like MFS transporter